VIQHYTPDGRRVYTAHEAAILRGRGEKTKTIQTRLQRAKAKPAGWITPNKLAVYYPEQLRIGEVPEAGAVVEG
jgi:peptidoglycan hydrolase-like protein with peptidoglycan-binding domain